MLEAGGGINVYSESGIGTTFRIYLPASATAGLTGAPTAGEPAALPHGAGRTVLVVEDENALRRVVTRILANGGYHVVGATSGPEAIELLGRHGADVLLTDVIMPEMSGTQLAELLHRRSPDLPVVFMSGYRNGLLGATHVLDDDVAFLEKPFTATQLLTKLAKRGGRGGDGHQLT